MRERCFGGSVYVSPAEFLPDLDKGIVIRCACICARVRATGAQSSCHMIRLQILILKVLFDLLTDRHGCCSANPRTSRTIFIFAFPRGKIQEHKLLLKMWGHIHRFHVGFERFLRRDSDSANLFAKWGKCSNSSKPFEKRHLCRHTLTILLVRVESLQFLQEDVAVGDGVVLIGHDEELEDGASAGAQEQNGAVLIRPGLCVHHNLIQLVPVHTESQSPTTTPFYL